jgi:glutamine amidotransferase
LLTDCSSWFAYLSPTEDCLLEDVLVTPKHSLARQVNEHYLPKLLPHPPNPTEKHEIDARNRLFNIDGLGVAWYTPTASAFQPSRIEGVRPATYKTTSAALRDPNFLSICANTSAKALFAHIRAATATATTPVNNHPFVFGRHALMHNGTIADFAAIRRDMCALMGADAYAAVQGATDSEHLAALYMTFLTDGGGREAWERDFAVEQMDAALWRAIEVVVRLQKKILGNKAEPNSLNVAVTDGDSLVCYRLRNHRTEQPPSLYYSTRAGVTLNRKYPDGPDGPEAEESKRADALDADKHGKHIIVSSEPSTYKESEWEVVPKNHKILVEKNVESLVVRDINVPDDWNVEDDMSS